MAGKMDAKVRIVRCPRCLRVLPEPPDVPVYECGGCGAKLQAKKRNNSTVDAASQRLDENSSGKQKVGQVFVDQETGSSSNQQSLLNSTNESDQNSDHNDLHSSNNDQDAVKKLKMKQLSDDCSSNQQSLVNSSDEPDQNIHKDPRSSTEFSGHEDPESSPEATTHNQIDQEQEQGQNQKQDQSNYQQSLFNSTDESDQKSDYNDLHSSNKDQDAAKRAKNSTVYTPPSVVEEYSSSQLSDNQEPCFSLNQQSLVNSGDEPDQNIHNDPSSSTEFSGHEDPESSSPEATAHNRINQGQEQKQTQKRYLSHYQDAGKKQENVTVVGVKHSSSKQKIKQISVDNEHNEHRSSSELSYHDDLESSPETTVHDRVNQHETEFVSCRKETEIEDGSSDFEETIANTKIISDSYGGSNPSFRSMIAEKLLDTRQKKVVYLDEDDLLSEDGGADLRHRRRFSRISSVETMETARFGGTSYYGYDGSVSSLDGNDDQIPRKNHTGSIRDEHVDSENRNRFNRRNEFHQNPRHRSSMISENPKMERIELLKLVRELQDQLERTNGSHLQQVPSYYDHDLKGRYGRRMAFSGEATTVNRRRDVSSCHHCCPRPQARHFSAQLPHHHHACCNGPNYGLNYEPNAYHSPRFYGPSSPKHNQSRHSESDFSESDDHWQLRNDVRKPFASPKKKQYVRPIAGGSPWITCYLCSKLLQLPQSFLLFNKRYHSLRCGGCLKVLNFTVSNGTRVSRYYPEETIAPPSSEVEDFDKLIGPVSCSDGSFEKSYSTEIDRNGSREFSEERKKAAVSRDPSGSTRPSSSKISGRRTATSEIEEVDRGLNGSPLHRLMGYASPGKVIRG